MSHAAAKLDNIVVLPTPSTKQLILYVDDDPMMLELAKASLKKDFSLATFDNHLSIVKTVDELRPALILLDVHMPNIDGFELISQLKKHPYSSDTPIVGVSGDGSLDVRARLESMGVAGFIAKPFDMKNLPADIHSIMNSLNSRIATPMGNKVFHVSYNKREKYKLLNSLLKSEEESGSKTIYLGWDSPLEFLTKDQQKIIESENQVFLQYKPSLVSKFSYLQDFGILVDDLLAFVEQSKNESWNIVVDEPMSFVKVADAEYSLAQMNLLSKTLGYHFKTVTFVNLRPQDKESELVLLRLGRTFIG